MRNFRIVIQYEGTRYQGWQRQGTTQNTLQGKFEALLSKIAGTPVEIQASGRTDAGVHALGQTANFHMNTELSCEELLDKLNQYLPEDVAVISCQEAAPRFHARLNAVGKTYCYRIHNSKGKQWRHAEYRYRVKFDIRLAEKSGLVIKHHADRCLQ